MAALNHAAAHANPPTRSTPGRAWRGWLLVFAAFWASFAPAWSAAMPADDPFDGAPSNRSSAWSTARQYKNAAQYSAEYKTAAQVAAQVTAPDYEASRVRARAQNSHLGFFGDPAKTRQENPAQVAKLHQEKEVTAEKTVLGRSVGSNSDPASLHKYLYAHADPVNNTDPSGHFSLSELNISQAISSTLSRMAVPAIRRLIKAKTIDVYAAFGATKYIAIPHAFIYVRKRVPRTQYIRYDVGPFDPKGAIKRPFDVGGGGIQEHQVSRRDIFLIPGVTTRIAKLSEVQFQIWRNLVLSFTANCNYGLLSGPNCITWTVQATAAAKGISKLPL